MPVDDCLVSYALADQAADIINAVLIPATNDAVMQKWTILLED